MIFQNVLKSSFLFYNKSYHSMVKIVQIMIDVYNKLLYIIDNRLYVIDYEDIGS